MKKSDYFYKSKGKNSNCMNPHYNFESCQKCIELWKSEEEKASDIKKSSSSRKDEEILPFDIENKDVNSKLIDMRRKYDLEVEKNKMLEFRLDLLKKNVENKDKKDSNRDSDYKTKRLNDTIIHLEKLLLEERNKVESLIQEKETLIKEKDEIQNKVKEHESINTKIKNEINYYLNTFEKTNFIKDYFEINDKKINLDQIENINLEMIDDKEENEYFICKICLNIAINPKICENCENLFCCKCIEQFMQKSNNCPCCRHYCNLIKISRFARTFLDKINIKCPFKCGMTFGYKILENHIDNCDKKPKSFSCRKCSKEIVVFENNYHIIANHMKQCYENEFSILDSKDDFNLMGDQNMMEESRFLEGIGEAHFFYILSNLKQKFSK